MRRRPASAFLGLLLVAGPLRSDEAADREALKREIQALRRDPIAMGDPGWRAWTPGGPACAGVMSRLWSAVAANECGEESAKILRENYDIGWAAYQAMFHSGTARETAWQALEAAAAVLGTGTSLFKCLGKTYVRFKIPPGVDQNDALTRVEAIGDLLDLHELVTSVDGLMRSGKGVAALGDTGREVAENTVNQVASGISQSEGWFENIQKALETFHVHQEAAVAFDGKKAEDLAASCAFEVALIDLEALERRSIEYLEVTRRWVTEHEQQAFCEVVTSSAWSAGQRELGAHPAARNRVVGANLLEGRARSLLDGVREQRQRVASRARAGIERRDRLADDLRSLTTELLSAGECGDATAAVRRLDAWSADACFDVAWASSGLAGSPRELRDQLLAQISAQAAFFDAVTQADREARAEAAACRFDAARQLVADRLARFDRQWAPHSVSAMIPCWAPPRRGEPYPLDKLRADLSEAERKIAAATTAAAAAAARARERSAACAWSEAMAALDDMAAAVGEIACPPGHAERDRWTQALASERAAIEARWQAVAPRQTAYVAAWRDLLQSVEESLFTAEQPQEAGRCAAADRVTEMVGVGAGMAPPAECPPPEELAGFRERLADAGRRAESARKLGRADFDRLDRQAADALRRCASDELGRSIGDLERLPVLCGADRDAALARHRGEHEKLVRRIDDFRARIDPLAREWAAASERCSIPGLAEVAGKIVEWLSDSCVLPELSTADRARVRALVAHTPDSVEALASRRETLRGMVKAKIVLAEGYLHTAEAAARAGTDPTHDRRQVERLVGDAFADVASTTTVPHACVEDLLERLSALRPRLEAILASLPPMTDPSDCSAWPGTQATPHPATGRIQCNCPGGTAWSVVSRQCLALSAGGGEGDAPATIDCSAYPGTLARPDPGRGWVCRCPVGDFDAALGRCVVPEERMPDPRTTGAGIGGSESAFCELAYNLIRYALARGDRAQANAQAATARAAGCTGVDSALGPSGGGGGGTVDHGGGSVSSRNVQICVIDRNSILDDHYDLYVNGAISGAVRNPEGGQTCFPAFLRGGDNLIELRMVREMGKSTALVISLNGGEYEGSFSGSHDHHWTISAP